jgi:hypothetical protein
MDPCKKSLGVLGSSNAFSHCINNITRSLDRDVCNRSLALLLIPPYQEF